MAKILLFILLSLSLLPGQAQKPVVNHIAFYVQDLKKSTAFYHQIVGLDTIPEPFHDGRHTWFAISDNSHLHLISGAKAPAAQDKNTHICFSVPSVEAFTARLNRQNINYEDWAGNPRSVTMRTDGVKQIYFRDPDGYWIEINDAR